MNKEILQEYIFYCADGHYGDNCSIIVYANSQEEAELVVAKHLGWKIHIDNTSNIKSWYCCQGCLDAMLEERKIK